MSDEIKQLLNGNKEFRKHFFDTDSTLFNELVQHGQRPRILAITCCDSRVDPAIVFNCKPGDLFAIRNVANLVPPFEETGLYHGTSAALEFGICFLNVKYVIILGHTQCGGIQALLENTGHILDRPQSFIAKWMEIARPAYNRIMTEHSDLPMDKKITLCEQYALINSLNNLYTFPWIQERVNNGTLSLHAWYFELKTGRIHMYDQSLDSWQVSI